MGTPANMNLRDIRIPENTVHRVLNYGLITRNQIAGVLDMVIKNITHAQAVKISDFTNMEIFCFGKWEPVVSGDIAKIDYCYSDEEPVVEKVEEPKPVEPTVDKIMEHVNPVEEKVNNELRESIQEIIAEKEEVVADEASVAEDSAEEEPAVEEEETAAEPEVEPEVEEPAQEEAIEEEPYPFDEPAEEVQEVKPVEFQKQKFQPKKKKH